MNHLKWMGHSATIFDIQKTLREDADSCEVTLVAMGHSVRAHRFILSSCSDLLRNLMADLPLGQEATIIVPDVKGALLDSVLAFIYMGETNISASNLSEFLEAINTLGIKSAISFECNTAALNTARTPTTQTSPVKPLGDVQVVQGDIIEQESTTLQTQGIMASQTTSTRELEFLDVYSEQQHKITYSIEHMPASGSGGEFILTENAGEFTLTQNPKLETSSNSNSAKIEDLDDDADDSEMIEEYGSTEDPIIEMTDSAVNVTPTTPSAANTTHLIEVKPTMKAIKLKSQPPATVFTTTEIDTAGDSFSILTTTGNLKPDTKHSSTTNDALELAVLAVINEGSSLQKAAAKFDVSKTVLWRRVRKDPNYNKTARENPVLTLAYERLKSGESMKSISRELDIPMSTLHRHKVRLAEQGRLPEYISFKKRYSLSKDELREKLNKALHACVHEGMSQNHAANLFDIPKSTLWRHLQKRVVEARITQAMSNDIKEEVILS